MHTPHDETERPCRACQGWGGRRVQGLPYRCPDCLGTSVERLCPLCGEWHGDGNLCCEDIDATHEAARAEHVCEQMGER